MICYLDTASNVAKFISKVEFHGDADAMVSKEVFRFLSSSKIAAVGMDIRLYRHSQAKKTAFVDFNFTFLFID